MAADMIGEVGLDVEGIEKSLATIEKRMGSLERHAGNADGRLKKFGVGLKQVGIALGVAFSVKAIVDYVRSFKDLSKEIANVRNILRTGTKDADAFEQNLAKGGAAGSGLMARWGKDIAAKKAQAKALAASALVEVRMGFSRDWMGRKTDKTRELEKQKAQDEQAEAMKFQAEKMTRSLSNTKSQDLAKTHEQLRLLREEAILAGHILRTAEQDVHATQDEIDAAKEREGMAKTAFTNMQLQYQLQMKAAGMAEAQIEMEVAGMKNIGDQMQKISGLEAQILKARREGNNALEKTLQRQQDIAVQDLMISEHNMTSKERREERGAARKRERDLQKAVKHEADLQKRSDQLDRQGGRATPGSELDRFRARGMRKRAAEQQAAAHAQAVESPTIKSIDSHAANIDNALRGGFANKGGA